VNRNHSIYRGARLLVFLFLSIPRVFAQNARPQADQAPQATPKTSVLLRLAVQCSKDIAAVSDCRSFTTNEKQEYIILKDNAPQKQQGYLLIPVEPITGVEDEKIFSAPYIDLWSSAWLWSEKYPGRPPAATGLALNSALARTQNQLHIHISCILPDVTKALWKKKISPDPNHATSIQLGPNRTTYRAVAVPTLDGANSPFTIARTIAQSTKTEMREQGIAVVRGKKSNGFYVLDTTENRGGAEELLNQTCASAVNVQVD
jgi:CDP-diacylglycerol pyrophosphatase